MYAGDVGEPCNVKLLDFGMQFDVTFPLIQKEKEQLESAGEPLWCTNPGPFPTEATYPKHVHFWYFIFQLQEAVSFKRSQG